jgi:hypothetical protein
MIQLKGSHLPGSKYPSGIIRLRKNSVKIVNPEHDEKNPA